MSGYIIKKKVLARWTYYLEYLLPDGKPVWTGLKNNAKAMSLTNTLLMMKRLSDCYPLELFEYE